MEGVNNQATVTVTLSDIAPESVTVQYSITPDTAKANLDYTPVTGKLTFTPGQTSKAIAIPILNDALSEANETFKVVLSNPTNASLAKTTAVVTITDTLSSNTTTTLPTTVENLTLTGTANINGTGNSGNNIITGNSGNNTLNGGAGVDTLLGGNGNDILIGGTGNDTLTGGAGSDRFTFNSRSEGNDRITDFSVVDDTIVVSAAGFGGGLVVGSAIAASQFRLGSAATTSSHRFLYDQTTGALFFDQDGTGAIAKIQFATLNTGLSLTNADIFVNA